MVSKLLVTALSFLLFSGCPEWSPEIVEEAEGKIPVYKTAEEALTAYSISPQPIRNLGKIYYKEPYLFALEINQGIHVIDNFDPLMPKKISFININGVNDMAIAENFLYVDNLTDLVTLDIGDIENIKEVSRKEDVFEDIRTDSPPGYYGYFECPDPEKGVIVDWIDGTIINPDCYIH